MSIDYNNTKFMLMHESVKMWCDKIFYAYTYLY